MRRRTSQHQDQEPTVDPCPEPAPRPVPEHRTYQGVTVAPDEWFPERFALKFRKTDSQYLRVGDLSLGELWELHHELGHLLAVMDAVPKGDSDG